MSDDDRPPGEGPHPADDQHPTDDRRWLDDPANVTRVVRGLVVVCALVFVADLVLDEHPKFDVEGWPFFYAVYGFVVSVGLVLTAKWLRRFLQRPEDYYEPVERWPDDE
jgi:hypothetical protein